MAFTLPNAIEYGVTTASLEQAEPDALDFQILGERRSFVISGGDVTSTPTAHLTEYIDIPIEDTEVYIDGQWGTITGRTVTIDAAPGSGTRFDVVCARYDAGGSPVWDFYVVKGTVSTNNPVFPTVPPSGFTLLPLYAVIVRADLKSSTLSRVYVDKRVFGTPTVIKSGSASPTGGVSGDLYVKTGSTSTGQSALWVNVGGTWKNIGEYSSTNPVTTAATNNSIALRSSSGQLTASQFNGPVVGNVTGAVTGNADTATKWANARTITLGNHASGSVSVDGSANVTLDVTSTLPRVYVQGSAPSSPQANDLWIQV